MSDERSDDDMTVPRRRPSALIGAAVAAVVLAGGGGMWWAATADDGGSGAASSASGRTPSPAPLDVSGSAGAPAAGIAPGEPAPTGVVYRAPGALPRGPATASVHRADGAVTSSQVSRLARALGMRGAPRAEGAFWLMGSAEGGAEPYLRVARSAPGTWSYARGTGVLSPCPSGSVCADGPGEAGPVGPEEAKAAARPVLDAAGLGGATLGTDQLMGAVRVVNADPVVGGLPTYGWSTGVQVGPDGTVTGASGRLSLPAGGAAYPVVTAAEAVRSLNADGAAAAPDPAGCATPEPLGDPAGGPEAGGPACVPSAGRPVAMTVEDAVFGLSAQYADGGQALVPSWLLTVRPEAGGEVSTVARIAVDPAYLARSPEPKASGGGGVTSYTADGRTLRVTFWGGVCSTYAASAEESAGQVRITVTESGKDDGRPCVALAKELRDTVTLDAPLEARTVVDAASGRTVPRL
ncbi:hypothetical protein OG233_23305 [Streptomyces sp. NBC_01218]|uniref:hypothetical protein n=1 Tax=Streptomyces sp. NBC_01218 TaxID=2903780 RepID=UPI002E133178|nr:hypothetical protein OG233_23305 [Streptomyces sp. NBC_01218]